MKKLILTTLVFLSVFCGTSAQVIVTAAGGGMGVDGGPAFGAAIGPIFGIALDDNGNLYICDQGTRSVRKISPGYGGIITTIAGNGTSGYSGDGGLGIYAQLAGAIDVAVDRHGNVYIADGGNHTVRKVTPEDTITTVAGTGVPGYNGDGISATAAQLNVPEGIAVDSVGNIYIVDLWNHRIRKVDTAGIITTIVGTGVAGFSPDGSGADTAKLDSLGSIRLDKSGNIFFADNVRIRKMDTSGIITTVAGNGIIGHSGDSGMATAAEIGGGAIAIDSAGGLFIAEQAPNRVRKVDVTGIINTIAGNGFSGYSGDFGDPLLARLNSPSGVAVSNTGEVYIADMGNGLVRLITAHPLAVFNRANVVGAVNVFPNPSSNNCTIQISSSINEPVQVIITNVTGTEVVKFTTVTNHAYTMKPDLPPGVYIISAVTQHEHFTEKMIVQ